ncbi:MAG: calcium-binding protein [Paracoccaceae bacterium]|jgi:Ca2+-binding RTX toxin-like protein
MFGLAGFLGLLVFGASVDVSDLSGERLAADTGDDKGDDDHPHDKAPHDNGFLDLFGAPGGASGTPDAPQQGGWHGLVGSGANGALIGDPQDNPSGIDSDATQHAADANTAGGGSDNIIYFAGDGDDELNGEMGHDTLVGEGGDDELLGRSGDDSLRGGDGNDWLIAGGGNDSLDGGSGDDSLMGGRGDDMVIGGAGSDIVNGSDGDDRLYGVSSADHAGKIVDDAAQDFLNGSGGDDHLMIGAGDNAHGGAGADRFTLGDWMENAGPAVIEDFDAAEDELVVVYDDSAHPAPSLGLEADPDNAGNMILTLDGMALAELHHPAGLDLGQVVLMPASGMTLPAAAAT